MSWDHYRAVLDAGGADLIPEEQVRAAGGNVGRYRVLIVLIVLAISANDEGETWWSEAGLARVIGGGTNRFRVHYAIKLLVDIGLLVRLDKQRERSTVYQLRLPTPAPDAVHIPAPDAVHIGGSAPAPDAVQVSAPLSAPVPAPVPALLCAPQPAPDAVHELEKEKEKEKENGDEQRRQAFSTIETTLARHRAGPGPDGDPEPISVAALGMQATAVLAILPADVRPEPTTTTKQLIRGVLAAGVDVEVLRDATVHAVNGASNKPGAAITYWRTLAEHQPTHRTDRGEPA